MTSNSLTLPPAPVNGKPAHTPGADAVAAESEGRQVTRSNVHPVFAPILDAICPPADQADGLRILAAQQAHRPGISARMMEPLRQYIEHGHRPGHFLCAVLANSLWEACMRADPDNLACLKAYADFLCNTAPQDCWGSPAKVKAWSERGGLRGARVADEPA